MNPSQVLRLSFLFSLPSAALFVPRMPSIVPIWMIHSEPRRTSLRFNKMLYGGGISGACCLLPCLPPVSWKPDLDRSLAPQRQARTQKMCVCLRSKCASNTAVFGRVFVSEPVSRLRFQLFLLFLRFTHIHLS